MVLKILLPSDAYQRLLRFVPHALSCRKSLANASLLGNTRVVECNVREARELLVKAKVYCPDAVENIHEAIQKMPR